MFDYFSIHTLTNLSGTIRKPAYIYLFFVAVAVLLLDQLTKLWIVGNIAANSYFYPQDTGVIEVIKGFFYIVHIGNEGAAWGMLSGHSEILILFTLVAFAAIYKFRRSLELHRTVVQIAFGMLIGGALGNLIDRLRYGHVIDFLDFHLGFTIPWLLPNGRYPAFNVADSAIVVGVFIYLLTGLFDAPKKEKESLAANP